MAERNPGDASSLFEAAKAIGETIGTEVLEKTGGDVYRSGQPLRGTPESEEPTSHEIRETSKTPEPKPETPTVEEPKRYGPGGKYTSMEEWEKATIEAGNTITALRRDLDQARAQKIETPATVPSVPKDPLDEIENFGIPKDPIKQAIKNTFQEMMSEAGKAYAVRAEADRAIISKYPEYQERFQDLQSWLGEHPEIANEVQIAEQNGAFGLAREYAWLRYSQERGAVEETGKIEESKAQAKEKVQRRADATVTDTKAGHTRDQSTAPRDPSQVSSEELDSARNLAKAGYERKAWANLLNPLLPKAEFFE